MHRLHVVCAVERVQAVRDRTRGDADEPGLIVRVRDEVIGMFQAPSCVGAMRRRHLAKRCPEFEPELILRACALSPEPCALSPEP